jgi:dTDP-4-dehydrorhamnose 3,5-epimerase
MIKLEPQTLAGVFLLKPDRFGDSRGFFSETFREDVLVGAGMPDPFVQDNHARTEKKGTLRGLHFQAPPAAQGKLVRVTRGAVLDVVVDIRTDSPTYGRHVAAELSEENWLQFFVPAGFAHGYLTLTDDSEVLYKTTNYYQPAAEGGLLWSDPDLGIEWPIPVDQVLANGRDKGWPRLADLKSPF